MQKDFITATPDSGGGNGTVSVTAAANSGAARSTSITISGGGITRTIPINQEQPANVIHPFMALQTDNPSKSMQVTIRQNGVDPATSKGFYVVTLNGNDVVTQIGREYETTDMRTLDLGVDFGEKNLLVASMIITCVSGCLVTVAPGDYLENFVMRCTQLSIVNASPQMPQTNFSTAMTICNAFNDVISESTKINHTFGLDISRYGNWSANQSTQLKNLSTTSKFLIKS